MRPRLWNAPATIGLIMSMIAALLIVGACTRESADEAQLAPMQDPADQREQITSLQVRTFDEMWTLLRDNYVYGDLHGVAWTELRERYRPLVVNLLSREDFPATVRQMLDELPPLAARWETREERIREELEDPSAYEGIGAYVAYRENPTPRIILLSVMPGSPADRSGLRSHEAVTAVNGIPVRREEGPDAVSRIRGPADQPVVLRVNSVDRPPRDVRVIRGRVQLAEVLNPLSYGRLEPGSVGYLLFPRVSSETLVTETVRSLEALLAGGDVSGIILDLRIASGLRWPLEPLLSLFSDGDHGAIYTAEGSQPISVEGYDLNGSQSVPLVVLIGRDTEGLPEVLAAALQARRRATVVGLKTPGNVESFVDFVLPDGSRLTIMTSAYLSPAGLEVGIDGVRPDVPASLDWDQVSERTDPVRNTAVSVLRRGVG
jgi:carboxyl-terminal processing protease